MNFKRYVYTIILVLLVSIGYAQQQQLKKANEAFESLAYIKARKIYTKLIKDGVHSIEIYQRIGDTYYQNAAFKEAAYWYKKMIDKYKTKVTSEYLFKYVLSLKGLGEYQEADEIVEDIQQKKDAISQLQKTETYLNNINARSGKFTIDTLSINSIYSEYAPSFYKGEIVFASSRKKGGGFNYIHQWNEEPFLDLYKADTTGKIVPLKGRINTKLHESSTTFSKDGNTVYFTRNNYTKRRVQENKKGTILLKIYKATFDGKRWKNIEELPFNSDEYSISHPSLSKDGKYLYFASDMPGGFGQSDLYRVAIYEDGSYGEPMNLGDKVNSKGRETFPFISDKGRLFFASDGHEGLGGLDVFMIAPNQKGDLMPYNLGRPINSSEDDFTFIINEEDKMGYFSSNRKGGKGGDDIYIFKQIAPLRTDFMPIRGERKLKKHLEVQPKPESF